MMKSATAILVTFPPEIELNPNPTGFHDRLQGSAVEFYNMLIEGMKLNVSLMRGTSLGSCKFDPVSKNTTCDGITEDLATGRADFALIPMSLSTYDPQIIDIPVRFGPKVFDAGMIFTSLPYEEAHKVEIHVLETLNEIPLFYLLSFVVYVIAMMLINYSVGRSKFLVRITAIQMLSLSLLRPLGRVQRAHRRLIYLCCLLLSFMSFQFLMGSTKSDMVVTIPAKYYETYAEVAASNRTPTLLGGLTLDQNFEKSVEDAAKQTIFHRAIERKTRFEAGTQGVFTTLATEINETIQFFDNDFEALCVVGISCYMREFHPPANLKFSKVFDFTAAITVYSQHIQADLRKHLTTFYQRVVEDGIYHRYETDVKLTLSPLGNTDKLTLCMMRLGTKTSEEAEVLPWNLDYYADLLFVAIVMILSSIIAIAREIIRKQRMTKRKSRRSLAKGWKWADVRVVEVHHVR